MASVDVLEGSSFLSQVDKVRRKLGNNFSKCHRILRARETALFSELDQVVATYRGEEITAQIQDLNRVKKALESTVQRNENKATVMEGVALMETRIRKLEFRLKTTQSDMRNVELEWNRKLERKLSGIGRIRMNAEENITTPRHLDNVKKDSGESSDEAQGLDEKQSKKQELRQDEHKNQFLPSNLNTSPHNFLFQTGFDGQSSLDRFGEKEEPPFFQDKDSWRFPEKSQAERLLCYSPFAEGKGYKRNKYESRGKKRIGKPNLWRNTYTPYRGYQQKYSSAIDDFYDDLSDEQDRRTVQDLILLFNSLEDESLRSDYFKSKSKPIKIKEFGGKEPYDSKDSFFKTKILPPRGNAFQEPDDPIQIFKPISLGFETFASSSIIKPLASHGSTRGEDSLDRDVSEEYAMDM